MTDWIPLFATYRVALVRDDEVVQGTLHPEIDANDPAVRRALAEWPGTHFLQKTDGRTEVTLVRRLRAPIRERWWLHGLLFLLTALTTTVAGSMFLGRAPLAMVAVPLGPVVLPVPVAIVPRELLPGLLFSLPLLLILLGHELGHYLVARRHGMDVSPPFFIPSPHWINLIGTFGAFIRLRSPMINRVMLLDVGAAGPVASFVLSIPVAVLGLYLSRPVEVPETVIRAPFVVLFGGYPIWLGDSFLFRGLAALVGLGESVVLLHPLALAGWLGLFVTALNLFPLSQLDGGHVMYALVGRWQRYFGLAFLGMLLVLGLSWWGWWIWAGLILVLGRGRISHPSVFDPRFPVVGPRRWLGWLCVAIFLLTFVAVPIQV